MNLAFLKKATLETVVTERATRTSGGGTLVKQPTNGDLRVFKNGRVYPSDTLAEAYKLHYFPKVETVDPVTGDVKVSVTGMGVDVFSSKNWGMLKGIEEEVLFIAFVPRDSNPKIDLWGSCQYKEGQPVANLLEQGPSVFGKTVLVDLLADAYGVDWSTTDFVDLTIETSIPMVSEDNVYHLPKVVARGENKGKATYVRRELIDIYPVVISEKEVALPPVGAEAEVEVMPTILNETPVQEEAVASNGQAGDDLLASLL
jgi:hypothetical protein